MNLASIIKLIVTGDTKGASNALKTVRADGKKTGASLKQFGQLAGAGFAAAGAAAVAFGIDAAKTALDYESSLAKFKQVLKNANIDYNTHAKAIQSVISANEKFGTKEDDTLALLTQGVISTKSLAKATDLLTTAQNVSAATGKPLADSYMAVIKASQGQLRPLKALGLDLPVVAGGAENTKKALLNLADANTKLREAQDKQATQTQHGNVLADGKLKKAQQDLLELEQRLSGKRRLSVPEYQAVQRAQQRVADAQTRTVVPNNNAVATALKGVAKAQQHLKDVTSSTTTIMDAINQRTANTALTQSQTRLGQIHAEQAQYDELKRHVGEFELDFVSKEISGWQRVIGAVQVAHNWIVKTIGLGTDAGKSVTDNLNDKGQLGMTGPYNQSAISAPGRKPKYAPKTVQTPAAADMLYAAWQKQQHDADVAKVMQYVAAHPTTVVNVHGTVAPRTVNDLSTRYAKRNGRTTSRKLFNGTPPSA